MPRLLIGVLLAALPFASAPAQSLELTGEHGAAKTLTLAELAALPQIEVTVTGKDGTTIAFRGPTLRALVTLVGAPTGHAFRGPNMLIVIVAEASDGYKAAYMLAEVDEGFGNRNGILALTQDGKPLSAKDGPFRVIMPGEEHHARWIRMVQRISLTRVGN